MRLGIAGALLLALGVMLGDCAPAAPLGECSSEAGRAYDPSLVMCEPFDSPQWAQKNGFAPRGGRTRSGTIDPQKHLAYAQITDKDCRAGSCLKLTAKQFVNNSLNVHWPLKNAGLKPQELYFRYYLKLGADWNPRACGSDGSTGPAAGKFPGFADIRESKDPGGKCGNGGDKSDGKRCFSARGVFHGCADTAGIKGMPYENTCQWVDGAATRIGNYLYLPDTTTTFGSNALWDFVPEHQTMGSDHTGTCRRARAGAEERSCYCRSENNFFCGMGTGGMLQPERWYAVETYVRLNTPGQDDGVLRGWIDGELSYQKENAVFRKPGHDDLHLRTIWLNVYKGGSKGNCDTGHVYLDQMVVSRDYIGPLRGDAYEDSALPEDPPVLESPVTP